MSSSVPELEEDNHPKLIKSGKRVVAIQVDPQSSDPLLDPNSELAIPSDVSWADIMNSPDPEMERSKTPTNKPVVSIAHKGKVPEKKEKDVKKAKLEEQKNELLMDQAMQTESYAESYASVADLESLDNRMNTVEQTMADINDKLESLLSEREAIPRQLKRLYQDMNTLSTAMSEHVIALSNQKIPLPQEAIQISTGIQTRVDEIKTLSAELQAPPTMTSQIHSSVELKPKKKRAVK